MKKILPCLLFSLIFQVSASIRPLGDSLDVKFRKNYANKTDLIKFKKEVFKIGARAVPTLIKVMKSDRYPEKNRWVATFLLGRIAGVKSVPFILKFTKHPHWLMRMASLKTLLALKQDTFGSVYASLLKDDALLVRIQAIENIRKLRLVKYSPHVWSMLYDKRNYYQVKKVNKRANIIRTIIKTMGDLKFDKAKEPLLKMIRDNKYKDVFEEMDYALSRIIGKQSPTNSTAAKKRFWKKVYLGSQLI